MTQSTLTPSLPTTVTRLWGATRIENAAGSVRVQARHREALRTALAALDAMPRMSPAEFNWIDVAPGLRLCTEASGDVVILGGEWETVSVETGEIGKVVEQLS